MSSTFEIFDARQIESLRLGGAILADCLKHVASKVEVGMTTAEVDAIAEAFILARGGRPAFKGYQGFPGTLCVSINDEIVHGIPGDRKIREGDIVSLDGGVIYQDLYTDACVTIGVGSIAPEVQAFLDVVEDSLEKVVKTIVKSGIRVGKISSFVQKCIEAGGYSVVRQLTGHGLGSSLHQFPDVPNWGRENDGPILPVGTLIAIEPIAVLGKKSDISTDDDGWTIRTKDGSLACHFEHSILITEKGCEIIA